MKLQVSPEHREELKFFETLENSNCKDCHLLLDDLQFDLLAEHVYEMHFEQFPKMDLSDLV